MATKKKQHIIPECYLRAWCDPNPPPGHNPFIWRISKTGIWVTRRSPEKSFAATDKYTIRLPNGERNLVIEDTLGEIESHFVSVLTKIRKCQRLSATDRARLCVFAAAMHSRTVSAGEHWRRQWGQVHEMVVNMEQAQNLRPITSLRTAKMVELAPQQAIASSLEFEPPMLFKMQMAIFITEDDTGFITSDRPCVWFNPSLRDAPPIYRAPGLGQREIEVTLPLTPHHLLLISHSREFLEYTAATDEVLTNSNSLRRYACSEEFISWKGATRAEWFTSAEEPTEP